MKRRVTYRVPMINEIWVDVEVTEDESDENCTATSEAIEKARALHPDFLVNGYPYAVD